MSFLRHKEIYQSDEVGLKGRDPKVTPSLIVSMSLRLVIPWRVALQQSPPPLHQPVDIVQQSEGADNPRLICGSFT